MPMDYRTYTPAPKLTGVVNCYWTLEAPAQVSAEKQHIVPDGCMEMIFHYGDAFRQYMPDGSSLVQPLCFVFGQVTRPLAIEPTGATGIFSVRFQPEGFAAFATMPVSNMENRAVPLDELFGADGSLLATAVLNAGQTEARIRLVEDFLIEKLITEESVSTLIRSSIELIMQLNGQVSVGELTDSLHVNRRQLERKFMKNTGLSVKQLSQIVRLQATLKRLAGQRPGTLTAVAHAGNYYDQAHFIRDFRSFTGMSPKQFYGGHLRLSALFSGMG